MAKKPRPFQRFKRRLMVRFPDGGDGARTAFTGNVSASGLYLQTNRVQRPGAPVEMQVEIPNEGPITLKGVVVWAKKAPVGLQRMSHSGFGVRIVEAPLTWYRFCMDLAARAAPLPTR